MARVDHHASIMANNEAPHLYMLRSDARRLHAAGKLQKIDGKAIYTSRRTWRMIAHDRFPSLHPDVLALCETWPTKLPRNPTTK